MVRVLTWNIHGGLGTDGVRSTERIARVIFDCQADIVCLQEVHQRLPWSGFIDQPRIIGRILGWPFQFYRCLNFGVGGYGLGLACRFPVRSIRRHALPSVREQRGVLEALVDIGNTEAKIYCTHWGLDEQERVRQANALRGLVALSREPVVLCGDLNAERSAQCVGNLLDDGLLVDVATPTSPPTFPATAPSTAIDYILHGNSIKAGNLQSLPTIASDHLPVISDLDFS